LPVSIPANSAKKRICVIGGPALTPTGVLLFAKGTSINEEFQLKDILGFGDNWILIERLQVTVIEGFAMESRRADTIYTDPSPIYREISRIWKTEEIDLTAYPYIRDISPLNKLTELRIINLSGTHVDDPHTHSKSDPA
jgi:hypothetical protein